MNAYDIAIQEIADMEKNIFADSWTEKMIKDTLSYDYNFIIVYGLFDGKQKAILLDELMETNEILVYGYIIANIIADETELLRIAVKPQYRNHKIASVLMDKYFEKVFGNCSRGFLEVRSNNISARKLYEKYNYIELGLRKDYYTNPTEDGVIYSYEK